jgi:hypothetical protein
LPFKGRVIDIFRSDHSLVTALVLALAKEWTFLVVTRKHGVHAVGAIYQVDATLLPDLPEAPTTKPKDGLHNRQESEKEPLIKTDPISRKKLSQHESENLRTWLGMTWAEELRS